MDGWNDRDDGDDDDHHYNGDDDDHYDGDDDYGYDHDDDEDLDDDVRLTTSVRYFLVRFGRCGAKLKSS